MKKVVKKSFIILLTLIILAGAGIGVYFLIKKPNEEEKENKFISYSLNDDGNSYTVLKATPETNTKEIVVPEKYNGKPVTIIGYGAFDNEDCKDLEKVILPDSIVKICDYGFNIDAEVNIPANIEYIGNHAITKIAGTTEVCLPSTLKYFGDYAFGNSVKKVVFADSDTLYIGKQSGRQYVCEFGNINKLYMPNDFISYQDLSKYTLTTFDGVDYIGSTSNPYLIAVSCSLNAVYIKEGCKVVMQNALSGIKYSLNLANSVMCVSQGNGYSSNMEFTTAVLSDNLEYTFGLSFKSSATGLQEYNGVKYIGTSTNPYAYAHSLIDRTVSEITIHPNCKHIGENFLEYASASKINLPECLVSVRKDAFSGSENLKEIALPATVKFVEEGFMNGSFDKLTMSVVNTAYKNDIKVLKNVNIKDLYFNGTLQEFTSVFKNGVRGLDNLYINNQPVTEIHITDLHKTHNEDFGGLNFLTKISFDNSLVSLAVNTFQNSTNLETVIIPDSLQKIGGSLFEGCTSLKELTIPFLKAFVTDRDNYSDPAMFGVPSTVQRVTITNEQKFVDGAFKEFFDLEYVDLSKCTKLTEIPNEMFRYCTSLTEVKLPTGIQVFGEYCFWYTKVQNIDISSATTIESLAFAYSDLAIEANMSDSLTTLGDKAFAGTKITKARMPKNMESFGKGVFNVCYELTEIVFPDSITVLPAETLNGCVKLKKLNLPNTVTEIGDFALVNITIKDVVLPTSLKKIGKWAFLGATMESVVLPEGLLEVCEGAFVNCSNLKSINFPSTLQKFSADFSFCQSLTEVILPENVELTGISFCGCTSLTKIVIPNVTNMLILYFKQTMNAYIPTDFDYNKHYKSNINSSKFYIPKSLQTIQIYIVSGWVVDENILENFDYGIQIVRGR